MNISFFYEPDFNPSSLQLSEKNLHHAANVLRLKPKELICVTDGKGSKFLCEILTLSKHSTKLFVREQQTTERSKKQLHLAISYTKNASRIEWLVEKATEFGVINIIPLLTRRSERHHIKSERLEKIALAAMLQSQQVWLPTIHPEVNVEEIHTWNIASKFVAYCGSEFEKSKLTSSHFANDDTLIMIGPEGDFTTDEIAYLLQHNVCPVSLGENRLRTETAGLYVCALYNASH